MIVSVFQVFATYDLLSLVPKGVFLGGDELAMNAVMQTVVTPLSRAAGTFQNQTLL